ncbi:hypothetical protein POF50_005415 [Streptomyces sp. SL13]|uniref:Uncharacterized protein n=1 Tax=Streptantibioticus silvisoli TaxID=2705255 RepID=A0AA90K7C9_9ACTN|nr:hypothetical protein [Streptantibioticus silvisoli]MDI5968788.1 hypothetical protein [Streptantibioticus silvisoli]
MSLLKKSIASGTVVATSPGPAFAVSAAPEAATPEAAAPEAPAPEAPAPASAAPASDENH